MPKQTPLFALLAILVTCAAPQPEPERPEPAKTATPDGKLVLGEAEWRARLTPLGYAVLREKATELAFTGRYDKHYRNGIYRCAGCGTTLFSSRDKFDSRTGWPSFTAPVEAANVSVQSDGDRDEVLCRRCDGHLGHVFPDGPAPGGLRYCINSAALRFEAAE